MNLASLKKTILTSIIFLVVPFFSYAQSIVVDYSPKDPGPKQLINVSVESYDLDLNNSEISWYQASKLIKKGIGMKNFSFTTSDGDNTIKVTVKSGSSIIQKALQISTSEVDLLWEVSDSYEPPFYKGKTMPIRSSLVKVVAVPQIKDSKGNVLSSGSMVYAWKKDGSNMVGQSGYGKNSLSYPIGALDATNSIFVKASGLSKQAQATTQISSSVPEIHFYEYDLAYGPLYNKALKNNQQIRKNKINIIAESYFSFTKDINNPAFTFDWNVFGSPVKPDQKNLAFLNFGDRVGTVDISLKTDNLNELLQGVSKSLRLNILENE